MPIITNPGFIMRCQKVLYDLNAWKIMNEDQPSMREILITYEHIFNHRMYQLTFLDNNLDNNAYAGLA